jgi:hypothetical protein
MIRIGTFLYAHRWISVATPIAVAHVVYPADVRQRHLWIRNTDLKGAFNYAAAMAEHVTCEYMMFWDCQYLPDDPKAVKRLIDAAEEHDRIDIISPTHGQPRDHIHRVFTGNPGFLLIRTKSLARLEVPMGNIIQQGKLDALDGHGAPRNGIECRQYYTDDPVDFGRACKAADVKWYEHGGVTLVGMAPMPGADGDENDVVLPRNERQPVWAG